jgi:NADPH-dependent curcumin reductase CurA
VTATREIHLASRPLGWPTPETFRIVEVELPDPGPGEVLVRNLYMSVDPYMRGRMNDVRSYVPPFQIDQPLEGGAVGEVVSSNSPGLAPGQVVVHLLGWREHVVAPADRFRVVDPDAAPSLSAYLGVLGATGFTAYVGLLDVAGLTEGDSVFISGAAGAVGSVAGQIAKLHGASRVVGSAGSAAKVAYLQQLGFDAAFNYKDGPIGKLLKQAAPDGITVYFDNVGGDHLEAAIGRLRPRGRIALCGAISAYNDDKPQPGPNNLGLAVSKRLSLRGFIVFDHNDRLPAFEAEMSHWLRTGQIRADETIVDGLDKAPEALLGLLRGENTGKMVVRLAER